MAYKEKYIAFLDILGFKDMVKKSGQTQVAKDEIHIILDEMNKIVISDKTENSNKRNVVKHISDSIILSYEEFPQLVEKIIKIQIAFIKYDVYLRGAVTFGKVFDNTKTIYGPGIIRAYELESSIAIYPRIIIDDGSDNMFESINEMGNKIKKDQDGLLYINWKNPQIDLIDKIESKIKENKNNCRIRQKYEWLKFYLKKK